MRQIHRPRGVTSLEVQISLIVLAVALMGICPLVLMQTRLLQQIESNPIGSNNPQIIRGQRMIDGSPYVPAGAIVAPPITILQPQPDAWARRLGITASFQNQTAPQAFSTLLTEAILDDGDASLNGSWSSQSSDLAYGGSYRILAQGNINGSATWTFPSLTPGRYRVMISCDPTVTMAADAAYKFTDATGNAVVVMFSQTTPVGDGPWRDIGSYFLGSSFQIQIFGSSAGPIFADAARIGYRNAVTIQPSSNSDPATPSGGASVRVQVGPKP